MSFREPLSKPLSRKEIDDDPIERLAAWIFEHERKPPGPSDPPYGSDMMPESIREQYRNLARKMLIAKEYNVL